MKKRAMLLLGVVLFTIQPLSFLANESENEKFKQELLQEIKEEMNDISDEEIKEIIDTVEKNITDYIEHYEETPQEELLTKEEKLLLTKKQTKSLKKFEEIANEEQKPVQQVILEEMNPKLKLLPEDTYSYNEENGEFEFSLSKDEMFETASNPNSRSAWSLLEKGDVIINFDNGSSGLRWGHTGLMYNKSSTTGTSTTIEAPGSGQVVKYVNYKTTWHDNTWDRMSYNYVPGVYGTGKASAAANNARQYLGKGYSISDSLMLGEVNKIYCTELVFLAYLSQGVNLGNGMNRFSVGILFPKSMYCDNDLMYYFRQNMGGGMC